MDAIEVLEYLASYMALNNHILMLDRLLLICIAHRNL